MEGSVYKYIKRMHRIRDPIYGYIWITENERKIIDTAIFQRLRRIKQLAFTNYVYPSAEHSRFVHSLGVLQAATEIFQILLDSNLFELLKNDEIEEFVKILRYSALLHDIGHLPFSHASEKVLLKEEKKHEDISSYIINNCNEIREILTKDKIDPGIVSSIIKGEPISAKYNLIKKIISGEFDADRTDYLLRDSYMCGVEYGKFDFERFIYSFDLKMDEDGQLTTYIRKGNIHAVEALVLARYHYYTQVVFHRTRKGFDKVLELYLAEEFKEESEQLLRELQNFWLNFDDYYIVNKIKKNVNRNNWAHILMRLDHLKPVYSSGSHASEQEQYFIKKIKKTLLENGYKENKDFFVVLLVQKIHKLTASSDEDTNPDQTNDYKVISRNGEILGTLLEHSSLLNKFQEPIRIIHLYASSSKVKEITKIVDNLKQEDFKIKKMPI